MTSESKRYVVVPGEKVSVTKAPEGPYIYEFQGEKRVSVVGLVDSKPEETSFIPIKGFYVPREGDVIIGLVTSHGASNWFVDINSPYQAVLSIYDFFGVRQGGTLPDDPFNYLHVGDFIKARIVTFDRIRNPILTVQDKELGRIVNGTVITVKPAKVPRIIGRKGSMLETLRQGTGCDFFVAVNGRIHIVCANEALQEIAVMAIEMIESQSHTTGLTERVKRFIEEERKVRGV